MIVIVYVEGGSDKLAMERLLDRLIDEKQASGISIRFYEAPSGDRKKSVVEKVPVIAVDILRSLPDSIVVAMPDLHPMNKGCKHETPQELFDGIMAKFIDAFDRAGLNDERVKQRFKVFCFKHDLEALILACEDQLKARLKAEKLKVDWTRPVEDQNDVRYPKLVVEELFKRHSTKYEAAADAPFILSSADLDHVVDACPQCFKPFVDFLRGLPTV